MSKPIRFLTCFWREESGAAGPCPISLGSAHYEQKADQLTFLPDGNGDFTRGMGMLVGKEDIVSFTGGQEIFLSIEGGRQRFFFPGFHNCRAL